MFKQNIKKQEQKQIKHVPKKNNKQKNYGVCFHAEKNGMWTGRKKCKKQIFPKYTELQITEFTEFGSG